jgi:hypothetical protein
MTSTKFLPLSGLDSNPSVDQPMENRYTDCAILASPPPKKKEKEKEKKKKESKICYIGY